MSKHNAHYDSTAPYPRDLVGYGRNPPQAQWPGQARIAVQFVLNYEEGGENATLHGDAGSEQFLSEMFNPPSFPDRHLSMEGIYEYGSRAGVWRILREFEKRKLPLTVFGISMALERHPEVTQAFIDLGHEIACHGWRWINYQTIDEATERANMQKGIEILSHLTKTTHGNSIHGAGWYTGRDSPNTHRLVADHAGFEHDSDYEVWCDHHLHRRCDGCGDCFGQPHQQCDGEPAGRNHRPDTGQQYGRIQQRGRR